MVASAFGDIASTQGLHLENLRQRKRGLLYRCAEGVFFALRTFGGEEDPQQYLKRSYYIFWLGASFSSASYSHHHFNFKLFCQKHQHINDLWRRMLFIVGVVHSPSAHTVEVLRSCWGLVLKCYELRTRQHRKC
jgi:hypothetical protein